MSSKGVCDFCGEYSTRINGGVCQKQACQRYRADDAEVQEQLEQSKQLAREYAEIPEKECRIHGNL